jgi:hypothetical protein
MEPEENTFTLSVLLEKLNSTATKVMILPEFSKELTTVLLDYLQLLSQSLMEVNHLHQEWDLNSLEMELILQIWFR